MFESRKSKVGSQKMVAIVEIRRRMGGWAVG
jgi:hypothetical protein